MLHPQHISLEPLLDSQELTTIKHRTLVTEEKMVSASSQERDGEGAGKRACSTLDRFLLGSQDWPQLECRLSSNSKFCCSCLPRPVITGMCHYALHFSSIQPLGFSKIEHTCVTSSRLQKRIFKHPRNPLNVSPRNCSNSRVT